jgi:hypothetical protein
LSLPLNDTIATALIASAAPSMARVSNLFFIFIESPPLAVHPIELSLHY